MLVILVVEGAFVFEEGGLLCCVGVEVLSNGMEYIYGSIYLHRHQHSINTLSPTTSASMCFPPAGFCVASVLDCILSRCLAAVRVTEGDISLSADPRGRRGSMPEPVLG